MSSDDEARALTHLVARIREAEQRVAIAEKHTAELEALRARVRSDGEEIRALRSAAATAATTEKKLDAANVTIERLLKRVGNAERRRDAAVATEAEARARRTALEREVVELSTERDRVLEDLRRFRGLRWNRLGIRLRVPVNKVRAVIGR